MQWWRRLVCWWRGHEWRETAQMADAEEFMSDRFEDAIHVYETCDRCGAGRWVFFDWGMLADYERNVSAGP
ncbi:MAG: hypothetical protein IPM06_22540 [Rhizobiales bacterium]|nr:hypothetical protein [Hyphomicrobiales bacterium]